MSRLTKLLSRQMAKNSGWSLGTTVVVTGATFAELVILARFLGPTSFGVYVLIVAYPEAVQQILDFRTRDGMMRYLGAYLATGRKRDAVAVVKLLWLLDAAVSALAFLVVLVSASFVSDLIVDESGAARLMVIYAVGLFLASLDSASGTILRVLDRFALSFGVSASATVGRLAFVIVAVTTIGTLEAVVWARVAGELLLTTIQGGVGFHALAKQVWSERRASVRELKGQYGEIRSFLFSTNLIGLMRMAATKLDTILVGLLAPPATVGIYRIATRFASIPVLVTDALYVAIYPRFARDYALGRIELIRRLVRQATLSVAALMIPASVALGVLGGAVITLFAGEAYASAHLPLAIGLLGMAPYVPFFWAQPLLLAAGHARSLLVATALATVTQLALIASLVPSMGAEGAAIGTAAMWVLLAAVQLASIRRLGLLSQKTRPPDDEAAVPSGGETGDIVSP